MCGRFTLTTTNEELMHRFELETKLNYPNRWNIAPSQTSLTVICDNSHNFCLKSQDKFGFWQSGLKNTIINARSETINHKPLFREAFKNSRCLVLASGWFEWDVNKTPYYVSLRDTRVMAFAGLRLKEERGFSFVIITTSAIGALAKLHNRTPLILKSKFWADWLGNAQDVPKAHLSPPESHFFKWHVVSSKVGDVVNDNANLIQPVSGPQSNMLV